VAEASLLAVLAVASWAGCGGGSSGSSGTTSVDAELLGDWSCSGTQIETCGTATHSDLITFAMTVTQGASPNAIQTALGSFRWTVSGSTANLDAPLTEPTGPGSVGGTWTPTYTSGTLTRPGSDLVWSAAGTAVYVNGVTQTCGFTQSYTCAPSGPASLDAGTDVATGPTLDPTLEGTWSYSGQYFYPDPPGTPGIDIVNPPLSLLLSADGSYTASASSVPLTPSGTWFVGATTPADWTQWRQLYNYPEKLTLVGADGVTWDGYVDDGDPSGETVGPPQCLDLFYTESQPMAGYYWLTFCHSVGTKK
jgi:hypothetical protein